MKPKIAAEALVLCRDHPLAESEQFLIALSESLARLHHTATNADRIAVLNKATAEHTKRTDADDIAAARAEGALAERERVKAILTSPEAKGREAFAQSLALGGDLPVSEALEALRASSASTILRSADAPGGLLIMGADGKPTPADAPVISVSPSQPPSAGASKAKAMWSTVIAGINAEGGGKAAAK